MKKAVLTVKSRWYTSTDELVRGEDTYILHLDDKIERIANILEGLERRGCYIAETKIAIANDHD